MVEQIPPAASDLTLGNSILPRVAERRFNCGQADIYESRTNGLTEVAVPVMNQKSLRVIKGECLAQLLRDPQSSRVIGDVAAEDTLTIMRDDEETVQDMEGERWDSEEIHCSYGLTMILEECLPTLCRVRILWYPLYPSRHSSFGDIKTSLSSSP
jgi:hypothetical protein